ncbi:SsrA-binding protein SmpB [Cohaesibacter gelatinilyticus]|uniref:SsrA-binding protein n=1 Tax=Cohaesibacter gelatinilyticus TaxID=372072 RepID=A0A285NG07_9HYPH|nr:SsrA-binding protein SmpB [Cohaesibacter gelatinilyticus]SNZ08389.1 SsrA-binding protein [Cohaesibacter gelatinilyticus]
MAKKKKQDPNNRVVAENRKARHNYEIGEVVEAGLQLTGTEVKSLRTGKANIAESYASEENGEIVLINSHIEEYVQGNRFNHNPRRPRKLLLHKREIHKMVNAVQRDGMTIVPLKMYFNDKGIAKLAVAVCRGKKAYDKRQDAKKRDWQRDKARLMRERG